MLKVIAIKQWNTAEDDDKKGPSVNPFDNFDEPDNMTGTQYGKFNMIKADMGQIIGDSEKSKQFAKFLENYNMETRKMQSQYPVPRGVAQMSDTEISSTKLTPAKTV